MNRIYQGRVSNVEIPVRSAAAPFSAPDGEKVSKPRKKGEVSKQPEWQPFDPNPTVARQKWQDTLWQHHALFQDAVNYYVVCLLALAGPQNQGVWEIRQRLNATTATGADDELMVWRPFPRRGARRSGMRESVAPYLCPTKPAATPEECFDAVLAGTECAKSEEGRARLSDGLAQLLAKCTGDSGCKQAAPVFLPRFAKPDYKGNYGADTTTLAREDQVARFPFVVHNISTRPDSLELDEFSVHSLALPNDRKPQIKGSEAKAKLKESLIVCARHAMRASLKRQTFPRFASLLAAARIWKNQTNQDWQSLRERIDAFPDDLCLPGYAATSVKGDKRTQLFALMLFKHVERSEFTLGLLRDTTPKPAVGEQPPASIPHQSNGGDPIRLARGGRGYVFRTFTSLPCCGGSSSGRPQ